MIDHPTRSGIHCPTRRQFLELGGAAAAACAAWAAPSPAAAAEKTSPAAPPKTLKLGIASYTFRAFKLEQALEMTRRAGLKYVCLKSCHLPLGAAPDELAAIAAKVAKAGLELYGGGVLELGNEDQVRAAFAYGKAAGLKMLVASPDPAMLALIDQQVKQHDIQVAIHNHGPGDRRWPTPQSAYEKIAALDRRIGLCVDIGHTVRAGVDLVAAVEKCFDRVLDVHVKDITAATAGGKCIPLGRGVIDVPGLLRLLVARNYQGVVAYEYEAEQRDPLPGVCECAGYTRGVLAAL